MRVTVLFFGVLKDVVGRSRDELELPANASIETVFERYASQFPKLREMADSIAQARNQEFAEPGAPVADGDEIAFMPPVSGGSGSEADWRRSAEDPHGFYALTDHVIDPRALAERTRGDGDGAVITFEGVVRNHSDGRRTRFLDYECYPPLALQTMQQIGRETLERFDVSAIAIVHRLGRLEIGEASVVITVASPHRRPAYEASLEAINRLKKLVPIWKKEHFEDGEVWVEGEWDESVTRSGAVRS